MSSPENQHHNEGPHGELHNQFANQNQVRLSLLEAMLAISGVLVIIGTILAMSESHKIKIAAVWIFVCAVMIGSIAVGIRLTHEFRKAASSSKPMVAQHDRPYLWIKSIEAYLDNPNQVAKGEVVQLTVENTGNVPAFNVTIQSQLRFVSLKLSEVPELPLIKLNPIFLPAKSIRQHTLPDAELGPAFDEKLIPMIESRESFMYVFGILLYEGEDKNKYRCEFCFLYEAKRKNFVMTSFHNGCK